MGFCSISRCGNSSKTCNFTNKGITFHRRNVSPSDDGDYMIKAKEQHLLMMFAALAGLKRTGETCDVFLQVEPKSSTMEAVREAAETGVWAHRAVLGAASPYFHDVFQNSDQQRKRIIITVPRVTSETLRLLVDNMYTPTSLSVTVEEGKSLLAAATHLSVADVRDEASAYLARSLAVDNVLGIYVTAESNGCPALTALAENFIQKDGERVLQVDEFLSMQPSILGNLLARGKLAAPAECTLKAVLRWTMHRPQERREHLSSLLHVVQLPQVPRELLYKVSREEPIINNAPAVHSIALVFANHHPQGSKKNTQKSGRSIDSKLASSHSSGPRAAVSTSLRSLAVGDCNKNAEVIPDVSSYERSSGSSQAAAVTVLDDRSFKGTGTKNEQKSGRSVDSNVEESALRVVEADINSTTSLTATADDAQALLSAAATQLGVGGVRDAVCDFLERTLAADNALGIFAFAEQHACAALATAATRYINTHFEHVLQADELLALAPDALATLLESLTVPTEVRVLDAVLRWTQHRPQERQQYLFGLLRHVRLPLLSPEELTKRAHAEPLATAESRVQRQLFDALSFHHASSEQRALSAAGSEWYRPRQHRAADSGPHALLVVGGYTSTGYTSDVLSFELSSGRCQSAAALPEARSGAGVAVLDGRVYVVGGYDGVGRVNTVFVFDVARGSWSSGPSLTTSRSLLAAATLDGVLYAVGGRDSGGAPLSSAEAFDPREGVWRSIASMSTSRAGLGVAVLDGRVYAVGGENNNGSLNTVERYDPSSARWETVDSMSERRAGAAVCVVDDVLYAAGGYNGSTAVRSVERYRAGSGWQPAPSMITARRYAAVATHDGRLYVAGGRDDRNALLSSVEVFSPSSSAWSELPADMPAGRTSAAAVVVHWPPTAP